MEKKVIQALYTNVCAKDGLRPLLGGVHFESKRCYASDGKLLVIYEEGNEKLDGKTISLNGDEIEGRFPNVDSVFPDKESMGELVPVDIKQLRDACVWHSHKAEFNENDRVVINGVGYNVKNLIKMLNVMFLVGEPRNIKFYNSDPQRATVIIGTKLKGLIMPMMYEEGDIDGERMEGSSVTLSYENFINDYVFNSWKKQEKAQPLSWLD